MYSYGQYSKPYFRFSFPKDSFLDSYFTNINNIEKFNELLKKLWNCDEQLQKFKYTSRINYEGVCPMICCSTKKCKYLIRFTPCKGQSCKYKITTFNNTHEHSFLEFSNQYKKKMLSKNPPQQIYSTNQIQKSEEVSFSVSNHGLLPYVFPPRQIQQCSNNIQNQEINLTVEGHNKQNNQLQEDVRIMSSSKQLQTLRQYFRGYFIDDFYDEKQPDYEEKVMKKKSFLKNAIINIKVNNKSKSEKQELLFHEKDNNLITINDENSQMDQQIKQDKQEDGPIQILYSSYSMQNNLKKWGKSIYLACVPYSIPKIPKYFIQQSYYYPVHGLMFMGIDAYMRINIFGVGVIGGVEKCSNIQFSECCEKIILQFIQIANNLGTKIRSFIVQEVDPYFNFLISLKKNNPSYHFVVKKHLSKRLIIQNRKIKQPNLIFKLAYCFVYNRQYHLFDYSDDGSQQVQQFDTIQINMIMQKGRLIEPILTKLCSTLSQKNFGILLNKFIDEYCKTDMMFNIFRQQFILKIHQFCLTVINLENYSKNNIDSHVMQIEDDNEIEQKQQNNDNLQEKIINNKDISEGLKEKKVIQNKSQYENVKKKKTEDISKGKFMGFNYFVDCGQWVRHIAIQWNLAEKMGESIVQDHEKNNKCSLPKTSAQLFFRQLVIMFNQNGAIFGEPDSQFWRNIGFNSYGISDQQHIGMKQTLRSMPKSISFQTNWDIQNYMKYFTEKGLAVFAQKQLKQMLKKLPFYKLSMIYFSKFAHQLILTYQMVQMLNLNCFPIQIQDKQSFKKQNYKSNNTYQESKIQLKYKNIKQYIVGRDSDYQTVKKKDKSYKCSCQFQDYMGIPCMHILKAFTLDEYNLADSIDQFWKQQVKNIS